ncbi:hypothetical protein DFH05DRAFT_1547126 [Lentinula detonsa]|uniref:Uncharacterized protein n=1 Tax=Lentinula detonsa TaxID=2804962 RepID=A0A9W8NQ09_9AGAR|nr:hypothetical protein DFH05DRAFT_1547126 [Lentinula detonsa]
MLRRGKDSASADSADATRVTNSTTNSTKGPDPAPAVDQIKHDVFSPQFGRVGYGYGMANTNKLAMGQLSSNNIKLPVSALGSTETPTTSGEDPEQLASTTAAWVKQYGVDGIGYMNKADGNAEQWITDVTNALRAESPQGQYMLTHARRGSGTPWTSGAYVTVNTKVGGSIDRYNTQFYNQGASEYTTCDGLLTESSSNNPKPSVFEIQANGFELNKVVIGKPGSTGTGDASNGQTSTSTRAGYVSQAKGEGKRMDESLLCVDLRTPSTDPPTLAHLVALLLMLRLRPWVHLAASIATGTDDASPTSLGSPGGGVTAATAGASPTSSGSASATDHDSASASTTAPTDAGSDGSFVDNSSPASQTTDTNAAAPSTTAFNNGQRTPGSAARLQHLTTEPGYLDGNIQYWLLPSLSFPLAKPLLCAGGSQWPYDGLRFLWETPKVRPMNGSRCCIGISPFFSCPKNDVSPRARSGQELPRIFRRSLHNFMAMSTYEGRGLSVYRRAREYYGKLGVEKGGRDEENAFANAFDVRKSPSQDSAWRSVQSNGQDDISAQDVS